MAIRWPCLIRRFLIRELSATVPPYLSSFYYHRGISMSILKNDKLNPLTKKEAWFIFAEFTRI